MAAVAKSNATFWPSDIVEEAGFTPVANVLLRRARDLRLSGGELLLVVYLLSFARPHSITRFSVSQVALARQLGLCDRQVRRLIVSLTGKGMLRVVDRGPRSNNYDLSPLFERLRSLPEVRPAFPKSEIGGVTLVPATTNPPTPARPCSVVPLNKPGTGPAGVESAQAGSGEAATQFFENLERCGWRLVPSIILKSLGQCSAGKPPSAEARATIERRLADLAAGRAFPVPKKWTAREILRCCPAFHSLVVAHLAASGVQASIGEGEVLQMAERTAASHMTSRLEGKDQDRWHEVLVNAVAAPVAQDHRSRLATTTTCEAG